MEKEIIKIDNRHLAGQLKNIALPIAIQSIIASSLSLVDNLMVGSLGEKELAAVGVATQIYFIQWMIMFGFTSGTSTYMAQFWGIKDLANVKRTVGVALSVCLSISAVFFLTCIFFPDMVMQIFTDSEELIELGTGYVRVGAITFMSIGVTVPFTAVLRVTGQTKVPLYISIITFGSNTFLNYVLIFGNFGAPKLGVIGAATATVIARFIELGLVVFVVFGRRNLVSGKLFEYFSCSPQLLKKIVKNALPTALNETAWGVGNAMYVAAYARIGITEYAAVQVGNVINSMFSLAAFSVGDATLILVGAKLGEGKIEYAYALAKKLLKVGAGIGLIFGAVLAVSCMPIIELFDLTIQGKEYAHLILIIYGIFMWLVIYNGICIVGVLRAGGDTLYAMLIETGSVWLYAVPMAFVAGLYWHLPIHMVVFLVKTEEILKFVILLRRFYSKKWAKNVVSDVV